MSDQQYDEKELRKREEKSTEEKTVDEKWRRDPLSAVVWAAILIWAGIVLLLNNLGYVRSIDFRLGETASRFDFRIENWGLIFLGAGVIVLIEVAIRLLVPSYRRQVTGTFIFALVLIAIGVGNWELIWPFILIAIGLSVLLGGITRRR